MLIHTENEAIHTEMDFWSIRWDTFESILKKKKVVMKDHKVIDTNELRIKQFSFSGLSEKKKNILIAGGLSFAGIAAAVGINQLFQSDKSFELNPKEDASKSADTNEDAHSDFNTENEPMSPESSVSDSSIDESSNSFDNTTAEDEPVDDNNGTEIEYTISFDSDAQFAQGVDDEMTFSRAFAHAREEVGMGGFFNWRSNSYSTYTKEEWDAMSYDDQQQFFADVSDKTQLDVDTWRIETNTVLEHPESSEPDEVEDIQNPAANDDIVDEDVETITIVPPAAAYGSADMNDDNVVDAIVIDTNHDGKADLLAMDENFDGVYESFQINEDGDKDLDVFIIDHGGDGIDDGDEITEIADVVDMEDFIILDSDDEVLEGLDFIDELIDVEEEEEDSEMDDTTDDLGFDDPGL